MATTNFVPKVRSISSITNANPALVTTTEDHGYISGTIVRIYIPLDYGMQQLDLQQGPITVVNATQFTLPINTILYDTFAAPVSPTQVPQSVPIGEITSILFAAKDNIA